MTTLIIERLSSTTSTFFRYVTSIKLLGKFKCPWKICYLNGCTSIQTYIQEMSKCTSHLSLSNIGKGLICESYVFQLWTVEHVCSSLNISIPWTYLVTVCKGPEIYRSRYIFIYISKIMTIIYFIVQLPLNIFCFKERSVQSMIQYKCVK